MKKKYLAFEVLLELILDNATEDYNNQITWRNERIRRNEVKGFKFYHEGPEPVWNDFLLNHAESLSKDRILVDYLNREMVEHNYAIVFEETQRVAKEIEKQMIFYSRLKYCGD